MESKSYLPKTEEFTNNQIKECPYCNAIIPLSEYEDHIFCHQLDEQENGEQSFNVNNFRSQNNNTNNINLNRNNNQGGNINSINYNNNSNNIDNQGQSNNNQEPVNLNRINDVNENNNNNQNNISEPKKGSFIDKIKNYFNPSNKNNNDNNQNNNQRDIMKIPIENLTLEEREERNKIEEQRAYEKKILGIANTESNQKVKDSRSTGEKFSDFIQNNSNSILAVIDVIGCLTLHTPSIGRTIVRISSFIGNQINNSGNNSENINNSNSINIEGNDYNNIIRNHPELKNKDKDPDTIIKFLPVSEVKEIKQNSENGINNNNKCIICLSEFEIGDQVSALPCAHVFHTECIASWIKKHCQCPVCKFNITLRSLIG